MKRLLEKQEINSAKQEETRRSIDEVLKIDKGLGALRETRAKEEKDFKTFRDKTLLGIYEEASGLQEKNNALKLEVRDLEERKQKALIPLDEEWVKVREVSAIQGKQKIELDVQYATLYTEKKEIDKRINLLSVEEQRAKSDRERATAILGDAESKRRESQDILSNAERVKNEADSYYSKKTSEIVSRETYLDSREKDINARNEKLNEYAADLKIKEIQLIDREETLEREIKRQNVKR